MCAVSAKHAENLEIFSNYLRHQDDTLPEIANSIQIWEACRATAAASSFFEPIAIGPKDNMKVRFVDGATLANNPVNEVWSEARRQFGPNFESRVQLLVSIGTGMPAIRTYEGSLAEVLKTLVKMATDTETTHRRFEGAHEYLVKNHIFYRFNVQRGMDKVGLEQASEREHVTIMTSNYMTDPDVREKVQRLKDRARMDRGKSITRVPELTAAPCRLI